MDALSFKEACRLVKKNDPDPEVIAGLDKVLTLVILLPALALGPVGIIGIEALGLLTIKSELIKLGAAITKKLLRWQAGDDPALRVERLLSAHTIIVYLSFFEALEKTLPALETILDQPLGGLTLRETRDKDATDCAQSPADPTIEPLIPIPHPAEGFVPHLSRLRQIYHQMTKAVTGVVSATQAWSTIDTVAKGKAEKALDSLVERSVKNYTGRYVQLATRFHEFFVWITIDHQQQTQHKLDQLASKLAKALRVADEAAIDVGFRRLHSAISNIPSAIEQYKRQLILSELQNWYDAVLQRPVIQDRQPSEPGGPELYFPTAEQIFVPQAFKVTRYTGSERLEDEATWSALPTHNSMGLFLRAYLTSPASENNILLILGHPGSGKSLLTQLLASRLGSRAYAVYRVELRDVEADIDVVAQIEQQVKYTIGRDATWASLADEFQAIPGLVILDGYDELLQATGRVHSGYLLKAKHFQDNELAVRKRPVRVIVTSRLNLIDKATIPHGSTVLRLMEFDAPKRQRWVSIWNKHNADYFERAGVERFQLPEKNDAVAELAKQPLLLLMLAIYDSVGNPLRKSKKLDQTSLYDSLIRRFVDREKAKDEEFRNQKKAVRDAHVDEEVRRLGIPALGMFNRRTLSILESQLNTDLAFFNALPNEPQSGGQALSPAARLLGSFFFVHESKAATKRAGDRTTETDVAFEFLHNTFGEFLTADFILRTIITEAGKLAAYRQNATLESELRQRLVAPNGFPLTWFACFLYTPLYSRPVVIDMIQRWLPAKLSAVAMTRDTFEQELASVVDHHIALVLNGRLLPNMLLSREGCGFHDLPVIGHSAIYTVNLMTLAAVLIRDGYRLVESSLETFIDGARPWDRLLQLWRGWFSLESLSGLANIIGTRRAEDGVYIAAKPSGNLQPGGDRLMSVVAVAEALSDGVTAGLGQYLLATRMPESQAALLAARDNLRAERINIDDSVAREQLRSLTYVNRPSEHVRNIVREAFGTTRWSALVMIDALRAVRGRDDFTDMEVMERSEYHFRGFDFESRYVAALLAIEMRDPRSVIDTIRGGRDVVASLPPEQLASVCNLASTSRDERLTRVVYEALREMHTEDMSYAVVVAAMRLAWVHDDRPWIDSLVGRMLVRDGPVWKLMRVVMSLIRSVDDPREWWRGGRFAYRYEREIKPRFDVPKVDEEIVQYVIHELIERVPPQRLAELYDSIRPALLHSLRLGAHSELIRLAELVGDGRVRDLLESLSTTRRPGRAE